MSAAKWDWPEVASIVRPAVEQCRSMSGALMDAYGVSQSGANYLISEARRRGHDVPYAKGPGRNRRPPIVKPRLHCDDCDHSCELATEMHRHVSAAHARRIRDAERTPRRNAA